MFVPSFLMGRKARRGGISAALTAAFIAAMVLLNLVAAALAERFQLRFDLTSEQVFVLSRESKDYLARLESDVDIYILTSEQTLISSGELYLIQANEVIKQYATVSSRVSVEYVDLTRNPGFRSRFPQYQLSEQTILLESDGNVVTLMLSDLFNIETQSFMGQYMEWIASSKAEQAMTSAIMGVTARRVSGVSILTGFGEGDSTGLADMLTANRYNVTERGIYTGEMDFTADVAIIFAPRRDYTEEALRKLDAFLREDSEPRKTLIYFAGALQSQTPNLDAFLEEWGISVGDGVIYQTNPNLLLLTGNPLWSVVSYAEKRYSERVSEQGLLVVMPEARPLTRIFGESGGKRVYDALFFEESVRVMPLDAGEDWDPGESTRGGPFPAMIVSEENGGGRVVVVASDVMAEESVLAVPGLGNGEYILSMLAGLTGREEGIIIAPKAVGVSFLPITELQAAFLAVIFVAVLPFAALAAGGAVYFSRRNL